MERPCDISCRVMEFKRFQLFINGQHHFTRGLDLACNPYNGNVLGEVVLVADTLLKSDLEDEEETVKLFKEEALHS